MRETDDVPSSLHRRRLARAVSTFADSYLDILLALDPSEVRRAPCFGYGRGGIAYVLLRAGLAGKPELFDSGLVWAKAGRRTARTFRLRGWPKSSYSRGLAGLYAIEARLHHARGDHAARDQAIDQFIATCARARGSIELFQGTAGRLAGAAALYRATEHRGVHALADRIAGSLARELDRREAPLTGDGVAHGWPGVALALLEWEGHGTSNAAVLRRALASMTARADVPSRPGWANGDAGMAWLFARAATRLPDERWLPLARTYGERALSPIGGGSVMSGDPGAVYATLALAELEPDGPWRDAADRLVTSVLAGLQAPDDCPWGVWSGLSGVYCMALDLMRGTAEFPGVSV